MLHFSKAQGNDYTNYKFSNFELQFRGAFHKSSLEAPTL